MGSTNATPTEQIIESSADATYTTPEVGHPAVNYTGKTRIRIYRNGIELAAYSVKATEALTFVVDPNSALFVYGKDGTTSLMTGSIFAFAFETEKVLFSGANEQVCDHSGFLSTNIYPYRDSDNVRTIDIFVTNRDTRQT